MPIGRRRVAGVATSPGPIFMVCEEKILGIGDQTLQEAYLIRLARGAD